MIFPLSERRQLREGGYRDYRDLGVISVFWRDYRRLRGSRVEGGGVHGGWVEAIGLYIIHAPKTAFHVKKSSGKL